jgi:hypothetical protein
MALERQEDLKSERQTNKKAVMKRQDTNQTYAGTNQGMPRIASNPQNLGRNGRVLS